MQTFITWKCERKASTLQLRENMKTIIQEQKAQIV